VSPDTSAETTAAPFDPRKKRSPRRAVGGPPPRPELAGTPDDTMGSALGSIPPGAPVMAAPASLVAVGEGSETPNGDEGRLPGIQRRPGSRQIHVTLSEKAYQLLDTVRAQRPESSYGDLVTAALVNAKPTLLAERPTDPEDPLLAPSRTQRLHVEERGRTRSRPFNVTPAQADAIRALAEEVGIPNISELVDRSVVLTYDTGTGG
jgi:hypothetical protein